MIERPTAADQIMTVCGQFDTELRAGLVDPSQLVTLDMGLAVLRSAAVRCKHELAWMQEEAAVNEALATALLEHYDDSAVRASLDKYRSSVDDGTDLGARRAAYSASGELLAQVAHAVHVHGLVDLQEQLFDAFALRRRHENAITGGFEAVGRT